MAIKELTLSLIIPAYNEENHLRACLNAVAVQTMKPREVIVVDNNSTDDTRKIAKSFPFVTLLSEKRQGQVFAQSTGFNHARGDILGRIDADSILPPNWTKMVLDHFQDNTETVAVTGDPDPYDIVLKRIGVAVFHFYHSGAARLFSGYTMLWGANCALRSSAWGEIKQDIAYRTDIWEDYDMAFLLNRLGKVERLKNLKVGCSFRSAQKPLIKQTEYQYRAVRTYRLHVGKLRSEFFFLLKCTMFLPYLLTLVDAVLFKLKSKLMAHR